MTYFEFFPFSSFLDLFLEVKSNYKINKTYQLHFQYSVLCKSKDKFIRLKNIIYDKYPEYKEYENYFLFNEKKINENETLEENKIKDGSIITIYSNYD